MGFGLDHGLLKAWEEDENFYLEIKKSQIKVADYEKCVQLIKDTFEESEWKTTDVYKIFKGFQTKKRWQAEECLEKICEILKIQFKTEKSPLISDFWPKPPPQTDLEKAIFTFNFDQIDTILKSQNVDNLDVALKYACECRSSYAVSMILAQIKEDSQIDLTVPFFLATKYHDDPTLFALIRHPLFQLGKPGEPNSPISWMRANNREDLEHAKPIQNSDELMLDTLLSRYFPDLQTDWNAIQESLKGLADKMLANEKERFDIEKEILGASQELSTLETKIAELSLNANEENFEFKFYQSEKRRLGEKRKRVEAEKKTLEAEKKTLEERKGRLDEKRKRLELERTAFLNSELKVHSSVSESSSSQTPKPPPVYLDLLLGDGNDLPAEAISAESLSDEDFEIPESWQEKILDDLHSLLKKKTLEAPRPESIIPGTDAHENWTQIVMSHLLRNLVAKYWKTYAMEDHSLATQLQHSHQKMDLVIKLVKQAIISFANLVSFFEFKRDIKAQYQEAKTQGRKRACRIFSHQPDRDSVVYYLADTKYIRRMTLKFYGTNEKNKSMWDLGETVGDFFSFMVEKNGKVYISKEAMGLLDESFRDLDGKAFGYVPTEVTGKIGTEKDYKGHMFMKGRVSLLFEGILNFHGSDIPSVFKANHFGNQDAVTKLLREYTILLGLKSGDSPFRFPGLLGWVGTGIYHGLIISPRGEPLIEKTPALAMSTIMGFIQDVNEILKILHAEFNLVHCDVSTKNIVVFADKALLIDYELSLPIGTSAGYRGSHEYMSLAVTRLEGGQLHVYRERDDFEGLFFVLLFMLNRKAFPWNHGEKEKIMTAESEFARCIGTIKGTRQPLENLGDGEAYDNLKEMRNRLFADPTTEIKSLF